MQELKKIWAFGLPYLRPYMFRFVVGVAAFRLDSIVPDFDFLSADSYDRIRIFTDAGEGSEPSRASAGLWRKAEIPWVFIGLP
jgi:hypothetical protein